MDMHNCPECGLVHSAAGERPESDEVKIARLQAERDIEVARVAARTERDYNDTREEVAKIEADADVAQAEALAEAVADEITGDPEPPAEPLPIVLEEPEAEPEPEPEPDVPPPPPADDVVGAPVKEKARGMWAGYR